MSEGIKGKVMLNQKFYKYQAIISPELYWIDGKYIVCEDRTRFSIRLSKFTLFSLTKNTKRRYKLMHAISI